MVKMKRQVPEEPSPAPVGRYVCLGCGYEYIPELGDEEGEVAPEHALGHSAGMDLS